MPIHLMLTGLNGVCALIALSLAAHGMGDGVTQEQRDWLTRGAEFQLWHAIALLALCALEARSGGSFWTKLGAWNFQAGIVLFCGSLYWLALAGPGSLGPLAFATPTGGLLLIGGWASLLVAGTAAARKS